MEKAKELDYIYITNNPSIALIAEKHGVKYIMVDMEYIGKEKRQGDYDSVKNLHSFEDIRRIRKTILKSSLIVRSNPIHKKTAITSSSEEEIEQIIKCGADIIMLPYFKTIGEVKSFIEIIDSRVESWLLLETPEAVEQLDDILELSGIDAVHIGLNDLALGYRKKFMFELLADGIVEDLCLKLKENGMKYGFGGIASLGRGIIPAEYILSEHYRLGSSTVILSRSFCNSEKIKDLNEIEYIFGVELMKIRNYEKELQNLSTESLLKNQVILKTKINDQVN